MGDKVVGEYGGPGSNGVGGINGAGVLGPNGFGPLPGS